MMKNKKILELLTLVNGIHSSDWSTVREIVKSFESIQVIKKGWNDSWKGKYPDMYPLDLSKISTWSTHDRTCIDLDFKNVDGKLYCKVRIYDGNSFDGYRTSLRFTAELILPNSFLKVIAQRINYAFENFLDDAYDNHLEAQKIEWKNNLRKEYLAQ